MQCIMSQLKFIKVFMIDYSPVILVLFLNSSRGKGYDTSTVGLWKQCSGDACKDINCDQQQIFCPKLNAARAFMTLVCIITPFAVCCLIFIGLTDQLNSVFLLISKGLATICFVFGLIGMVVGLVATISGTNNGVGPAGAVSIVGVILNLLGSIVTGIIRPT